MIGDSPGPSSKRALGRSRKAARSHLALDSK